MTCSCPRPIPGNRHPDNCAKCAKPILEDPLPQHRVEDFFDRLREALEAAGRIKKPNPGEAIDPVFAWFELACLQRLRKGAQTYGDANFLRPEVDLVDEALEEQMDTANYALLELTKTRPDDTDAASLGEAVCFAFYSAQALLRYKHKVRGVSG